MTDHQLTGKPATMAAINLSSNSPISLSDLDVRSREIFKYIVDSYLETGEPVGSRNLARMLPMNLSPASIRNVMADLEDLGLIYAPHISAGRLPTEPGLRFFVDAFLEVGDLTSTERKQIKSQIVSEADEDGLEDVLIDASKMLSGISSGAGLVVTPKSDNRLKHIEFVRLEPSKALVVLVDEHNHIENRIVDIPPDIPTSVLVEATNFLNMHIRGQTLTDARVGMQEMHDVMSQELNSLTTKLIDSGLAVWAGTLERNNETLIVRGRSNLLTDQALQEDLERTRRLFDDLEAKREIINLLDLAEGGDGVRVFIGSENKFFSLSGSSLVVSPYHNANQEIVGVLGIIGPTRLNYAKIVPVVDYTAQLISTLISKIKRK